MSISSFINDMKEVNEKLLNYIDSQNDDSLFSEFTQFIEQTGIQNDSHKLKPLLYLLTSISTNHFRTSNFFNKIEKILKYLLESIKKHFSDNELFNIFKNNKRILLFFVNEKIIVFDNYICNIIKKDSYTKYKYSEYFCPEITQNLSKDGNFEEKRLIGENDHEICKLIRKDSIVEFITYVNKQNISLKATINDSIFETNRLLLDKAPTLIEYAAFYGSIQIFEYLRKNEVELNQSIWNYVIHSKNEELIYILIENKIEPVLNSKNNCIKEAIKCHHNDIVRYFLDNFVNDEKESLNIVDNCIKYYNFMFINDKDINQKSLLNLCKYDHYILSDLLLNVNGIDINYKYEFNVFEK